MIEFAEENLAALVLVGNAFPFIVLEEQENFSGVAFEVHDQAFYQVEVLVEFVYYLFD